MPLDFNTAKTNFQTWLACTNVNNPALAVIPTASPNLQFQIVQDVAFDLDGRDILCGYAIDPLANWAALTPQEQLATRRFFWRSNSEGVWRAGTGFEQSGRLTKGRNEAMGYVYETQIAIELQNPLSVVVAGIPPTQVYPFTATPMETDPFRSRFTSDPATAGGRPHFFDGVPVANYEYMVGIPTRLPGILIQYQGLVGYRDSGLLVDTTCYQTTAASGLRYVECGATSYQRDVGMAETLKDDYRLWSVVMPCLRQGGGDPQLLGHKLFATDVIVETYRIDGSAEGVVFIELARLTSTFHVEWIKDPLTVPKLQKRDTTCCWVNNVRLGNTLSSYGNFTTYASDFSFLPQKPVDYRQQVDAVQLKKADASTGEAIYAGFVLMPNGVQQDLADPNWIMGYKHLFIFNEKYNWLVREFKRVVASRFAGIYGKQFEQFVANQFGRQLAGAITAGCANYKRQHTTDGAPNLGKAVGVARTDYLSGQIALNPGSLENVDAAMDRVLVKNLGPSGVKFKGMIFKAGISTTANGLFDFLLKRLLNTCPIPTPVPAILTTISGDSRTLALLLYMQQQNITAAGLNDTQREACLKTLRAWSPTIM